MATWMTYENIWARNAIFATFLFSFMFTLTKLSPTFPSMPAPKDIELMVLFILTYGVIFSHNHFNIRINIFRKKYMIAACVSILYALIFGFISKQINNHLGIPSPYIAEVLSTIFALFIGTCIYLCHQWVIQNVVQTKLKLLHREAELTFLKQQLSPHFLLNAINNLYGTALVSPEIITDKILELSDLLRYQIEATTKESVCITDEMDFIENYINYTNYKTNDLQITNLVEGEEKLFRLPPLLFLPLIENAIKYSAETENPFIDIAWRFEPENLIFCIQNSYLSQDSAVKGTKIGLENLKKRLQILNIKHALSIDTNTLNIYKIELKLWELLTNV
jgi:two-component system, LytTR family, sensor kinase